MTTRRPFQYALIRAVPRVDRGEFINIGVIIYCQSDDYLAALVEINEPRLLALDPDAGLEAIGQSAEAVVAACEAPVGHARENKGLATRFGILTAPRSTVVQPSPVHAGVTEDPEQTLAALLNRLVALP